LTRRIFLLRVGCDERCAAVPAVSGLTAVEVLDATVFVGIGGYASVEDVGIRAAFGARLATGAGSGDEAEHSDKQQRGRRPKERLRKSIPPRCEPCSHCCA
jgi:hypothetical protein